MDGLVEVKAVLRIAYSDQKSIIFFKIQKGGKSQTNFQIQFLDPEKEETLEQLDVVRESLVSVDRLSAESTFYSVRVEFVPTVPHCSLATLIGLCLITKLNRELPSGRFKIDLVRRSAFTTVKNIQS